jgi:biopolymer transport protein ExbB
VLEILMAGGWAMLPILAASAVALAIILERYWTLRRNAVLPAGLGADVREWARSSQLDAAHIDVLRSNSPLGELLAAALEVRDRPRDIIKERLEDSGRYVIHQLERYLNTLGTIALIAPLLGLLGTVIGLIDMFLVVSNGNLGDPGKMAGGIGQALICTATGLCVAIPAYAFHRLLRGRVHGFVIEMEQQASALLDELDAQKLEAQKNAPVRAAKASSRPQ